MVFSGFSCLYMGRLYYKDNAINSQLVEINSVHVNTDICTEILTKALKNRGYLQCYMENEMKKPNHVV